MEERPLKKSEVLAIENIKRIADQIRSERNDALALAQERREQLEVAIAGLRDARAQLADGLPASAVMEKIDVLLAKINLS